MKKILLFLSLLLVSLVTISQTTRPTPSGFSLAPAGSATTFNRWGGVIYGVVGYAPSIWLDTTTANASSLNIKNIPLIQIGTADGKNWYRDINLNKWNEIGAGGADGNNYPTSLSFNTGDGVLTMGRNGLSNLTVDLDGRFVGITDTSTMLDRAWRLKGNTGTSPTTHVLGTLDNASFKVVANSKKSGYIDVTTSAHTTWGYRAGDSLGSGNVWMTLIGYRAGERFKQGVNNVENTAIGAYSQFMSTGASAYENVSVGSFTLAYTTGFRNVAVGASALNWTTSGQENTIVGNFSAMANRQGQNNTGVGSSVLRGNVKGNYNVGVGAITLTQNTTNIASINVANGGSGYTTATVVISAPTVAFDPNFNSEQATATANISGGSIISITVTNPGKGYTDVTDATGTAVTATITGDGTGAVLTVTLQSGDGNTAIGTSSLAFNRTGDNNTAIGGSLINNLTGSYNTGLGYLTENSATNGINRTTIGSWSYSSQDNSMTLGSINGINGATADTKVGIGTTAARFKLDVTGDDAIIFEKRIGRGNTSRESNTILGDSVLSIGVSAIGANNTAVGYKAMKAATAGSHNTAFGSMALNPGVVEIGNTAIGANTMANLLNPVFGLKNDYNGTAVGFNAMALRGGGTESTGLGSHALYSEAAGLNFNTAVGTHSLKNSFGGGTNTSVGWSAGMQISTGSNNTSLGAYAMGRGNWVLGGTANTTGSGNTAIGTGSLYGLTTGSNNSVFGQASGASITTGSNNVILGSNNGASVAALSDNVIISDGDGTLKQSWDNLGNEFVAYVEARTDTTSWKPVVDSAGYRKKLTYWPGGGSTYTDEQAQDAVGAMINASLQYVDATPLLAIGDRDYGAITVSGSGLTWTVDNGAISNAMLANSTISGVSLGSNLADLTATDATLTFSGSYNGSTARTIGLNLGNSNTWTVDQSVPAEVYGAGWNGSNEIPTKNDIYDKIESMSGGSPGGSDTQVQFNDGGSFNGDAGFTYSKATDILTLNGGLVVNGIAGQTVVFNEAGVDVDFRIESDADANAFYFDGTTGFVGISSGGAAGSLFQIGSAIPGTAQTKLIAINDATTVDYSNPIHANTGLSTARTQITASNSASSGDWANNFFAFGAHGHAYTGNFYLTNIGGKTSDAGYGYILSQGSATNGLMIFTYDNKPLYIGANNSVRFTIGSVITAHVDISIPDEAFGVGWNGSLEAPTKNAIYDKIVSIESTYGAGTYTPTLTNTANLDASTAHVFQYHWTIDPTSGLQVVTVSGYVDVDPTTTLTDTQLTITIPIATTFGNVQECGGVANSTTIAAQSAGIRAVASSGNVMMQWKTTDVTNQPMYLTFTYKVTPP